MTRGRITAAGIKGSRPASENPAAGKREETRMPLETTTTVQWIGLPGLGQIYILVTHSVSTWQGTWRPGSKGWESGSQRGSRS